METLVKFCPPEYNILNGCQTIQFGTLEYYREMDPSFTIADEVEGKDSTYVESFQADTASSEAVEAIKPGFQLTGGKNNRMQDCEMVTTFSNCFIWCCSRAIKPISMKQGTRLNPDYTSHYEIADKNSFGKHIATLLGDSILGRFNSINPDDCFRDLSPLRQDAIWLEMRHHDVVYVEEKNQ